MESQISVVEMMREMNGREQALGRKRNPDIVMTAC